MKFLVLSILTLIAGASAVLWILQLEIGNGPRITQRAWLVVDAHHQGEPIYSDVLAGYGDADVLIPGLRGGKLKVIRNGQLYVRPSWNFRMVDGSEVVVEGEDWSVHLKWTDERPDELVPRPVAS